MQRKPKKKTVAARRSGPRTKWTGFRPMYDFWGNELKRFYKLETLQSAVDHMLQGRDRFLIGSFQQVLGPEQITAIHFELFQEGRFQLIFRAKASNAKKKSATFAVVVAKNHQEASAVAQKEYHHLHLLHERAPKHVVTPYRGAKIYMPDRRGRPDMGREIFTYATEWLNGFDELGIDHSLQFIANVQNRHVFSRVETEQIKGMIIEIIARSYDPVQHNSMDLPEIASGDFVVRRTPRGKLQLRLIACRKLLTRIAPPSLLDRILKSRWKWGDQEFTLAPESPQTILDALVAARGEEEARQWLTKYAAAVQSRKLPRRSPEYFAELLALI